MRQHIQARKGGRIQIARFARHSLLCGFAAWRELILQTVHDSRNPVFDQIFANVDQQAETAVGQLRSYSCSGKKGLTPSRKGAKKRPADAGLLGIDEYPNSSGFYANTVDP
jgi:hypothetical protein